MSEEPTGLEHVSKAEVMRQFLTYSKDTPNFKAANRELIRLEALEKEMAASEKRLILDEQKQSNQRLAEIDKRLAVSEWRKPSVWVAIISIIAATVISWISLLVSNPRPQLKADGHEATQTSQLEPSLVDPPSVKVLPPLPPASGPTTQGETQSTPTDSPD